jgi:Ca2+-binding RTX toxin-like protein
MAITASFNPSASLLSVFGDNLDNNVDISRNAAGTILVNGGAIPVLGGIPSVANTALIQVFGQGGNDTITMNETNGALPRANLFGGAGNDTITGGSGGDMLFGQSGNDVLIGKGGNDFLFGGSENDVLTGGDGDDQVFGESGNDVMIWNPGDDTDLFEGGAGDDTAQVNGGGGGEVFTVTANGARVRFDRLDPAPFSIDIGTTENLVVNMNGGDDFFSATGNLAALIKITVDGGAGNDTILGSNGADLLLGGDGNDFIDGQQGNDVAFLGAGNDTFQWDPGDGSDVVEGQDGTDSMLFNGSSGAEIFTLSANGGRALFTRNLGNIVMDLDDVEKIDLNALGGVDTLTVNDMSGTDVVEVNVNLAGTIGGTAGDGAADVVIDNATNGGDVIDVVGSGTGVSVLGLAARTNISNAEGANDSLVINGLGGNDTIRATALPAGVIKLTIDAGAGDDSILGSQGADTFLGGDGNDFLFGDNGNDVAFMGAGDDTFQWDPGDGNDTVEGQDGIDTLDFNGANVAENVDIVANGGRVLFLRNVANVTMDLDDVEVIDFDALGGADNIVVGDLSGTDATQINIDLAGPNGGGDGAADNVTVNATQGSDTQINVTSNAAGTITVDGLPAKVVIEQGEAANDRLTINGLGGDDVINASGVAAGQMKLTLNGGLGNDVFLGSAGDDFINGGDGNDVAFMGAGNDTFVWNPGDDNDTLEGQAGTDTMLFNGANAAENITISANGGRAIFFRDIATVTMDLNDTEVIDFNALGGADNIFVKDLSGTDVAKVNIDLAGTIGGVTGDNLADNIFIQGTNGDDVISLSIQNGALVIDGLASQIVIEHFDINDTIHIAGLSGDDVIEASGVGVAGLKLSFDGGNGNDVLIGSEGADTLLGGAGDDVLLGNGGLDVLDGGDGDDIEIQGATTLAADAPTPEVDTPTVDPVLATSDVKEPQSDPMPHDGGQGEEDGAGVAQALANAESSSRPTVTDEAAAPSSSRNEAGAGVEPFSPSIVAGGGKIQPTDDGPTGSCVYKAVPLMEEGSGGKSGELPKMLTFGNPTAQLLDYVLALDAMSAANAAPSSPAMAPVGHALSGAGVDHADVPAPVQFPSGALANPDYFFV